VLLAEVAIDLAFQLQLGLVDVEVEAVEALQLQGDMVA
jgi:hypothetical protein